ncbi:GGDEF domain-containing protein [uncultured Acinetobacter sp.]|uniref:GGDEF domain-containing protein n=1 Tax=uncultured Acinetobacter sp. TaxID=165433 RepID=UPI0026307D1A|nr:GGDEF domain-containing protein [uncultured Acinetobacter sp.]
MARLTLHFLLTILFFAYSNLSIADVRLLDFSERSKVELSGTWHYYPKQLTLDAFKAAAISVELPNSFETMLGEVNHHGIFRQKFQVPNAAVGQPLALFIPYQYGAYRLYINDKMMLKVGQVGTQDQHRTQMAPRLLIFTLDKSEFDIRLDFSSYQHIRGGPQNALVMGYEEPIRRHFYHHIIPATWVSGMLVMISLFMALFAIYRLKLQQPILPLLFLSLFILCFSLRSFFAVPFAYTLFTSIEWLWGTRIEYLLTALSCLFFINYIRYALPHSLSYGIYAFLSCMICANFLVILSQPPLIFQDFFFKSFAASALLFFNMLYGIYHIIKYKIAFSKANTLAITILCLTFIHDYLLGLKLIDSIEISFYTSCIYFVLVTIYLSRDYALQSQQAICYNQQLLLLNQSLDQQVVERTYTVIQLNEQLKQQLKLDDLTGAYNRYALDETLQQYFKSSQNNSSSLAFFMLDVDFFKNYNDAYGHLHGDQVLKDLVVLLQQQLPDDGFLARYGGEEFAILVPNLSLSEAQTFAHGCLVAIRELNIQHVKRLDAKSYVTISTGGVVMDSQHVYADAKALIHCADSHLYQAKQQRDCAIVR